MRIEQQVNSLLALPLGEGGMGKFMMKIFEAPLPLLEGEGTSLRIEQQVNSLLPLPLGEGWGEGD